MLRGKTAIVTAGASGLGLDIARCMIAQGAAVHVCDVAADALADALAANTGLSGTLADVAVSDDVARLFGEAAARLGDRLDILVNNAGIGGPTLPLEAIGDDDWERTVAVNLGGTFRCMRAAVPLMKRRGGGSIVNISTVNARIGLPQRAAYVASKSAILGLTHTAARELGPFGIRCNAVLPGPLDNARGRALFARQAAAKGISEAEAREEMTRFISLRTMIDPKGVAEMVAFLASDAAAQVTGQSIGVCGNTEWEA